MKLKLTVKRVTTAIGAIFLFVSCTDRESSFGKDFEQPALPTTLSYTDIKDAREFKFVETSAPFVNSNGAPVYFELLYVKKDNQILDASYLEKVSIENPEIFEEEHPDTGDKIVTVDISRAGTVSFEDGNLFDYGDYYFTIEVKVELDGVLKSTIFEDVLYLNIGPGLKGAIGYCPNKFNFTTLSSASSIVPDAIGGNDLIKYSLKTDQEKLIIDELTGEISLNPSYAISGTEYIKPTITIVSDISGEEKDFENSFTAILSTETVAIVPETNYFFYPKLKPSNKKAVTAGGVGYSVELVDNPFPDWFVAKSLYKALPPTNKLTNVDAVLERSYAGVDGVSGLFLPYSGTLVSFETWVVADPQSIAQYGSCFDVSVVFWANLNITSNVSANEGDETPVKFEAFITDSYSGDVLTANWIPINNVLTCRIDQGSSGLGDPFMGCPYPFEGFPSLETSENALNKWVKCEMDLAAYKDWENVTIAFRNKTNSTGNLPGDQRGNLSISDLYFVAKEKQN